jgi:hypothetical protein
VILYSGIGGLLLLWSGLKTITLASIVSPFSGVFGCGLWCLAMVWVDRKQMPKPYQMSFTLLIGALLSGVILTAIGFYVMVWGG